MESTETKPAAAAGAQDKRARQAALGTFVGHISEWYDFLLYGILAATIAAHFFPESDPTAALLATFATYGLAYVVRPLGGVIFGHLGDKVGRTWTLAITVAGMSLATFMIGVIPTYGQIGAWAALLLVVARLIQGLAAGGEVGGASAVISEYVRKRRRATWLAGLTVALATAAVLAAGIVGVTRGLVSEAAFDAWGWRVAFWAALPLGLSGLYLRLRLEETPAFRAARSRNEIVRVPALEVFKKHPKRLVLLFVFFSSSAVGNGVLFGFFPGFLEEGGALDVGTIAYVSIIAYVVMAVSGVAFGAMSDRWGRRPVRLVSCGLLALLAIPSLMMATSGNAAVALIALVMFAVINASSNISAYPILMEMFPAAVRYSAASISYNFAYVVFGSTTPFVIGALVASSTSVTAAGLYIAAVGVVAFIVGIVLPETRDIDLVPERGGDPPSDEPTPPPTRTPGSLAAEPGA